MLEVWQFRDSKNREEFVRDMIRDGLYARIRRRQRHALKYTRETAAELAEGGRAFTAERERLFTEAIKNRLLYEGACDLPWPEYAAFRQKHGGETLTKGDLAYLAAWTPCALRNNK
jgi:hypothetical protein